VSGEPTSPAEPARPPSSSGSALFSAVLFVVFATAFIQAGSYSPDAALFPRLISAVAMACAALTFAQSVRRPAGQVSEPQTGAIRWRDLLISYAGPPLYVGLMVLLGFWAASAMFLAGLLVMLGTRNPLIVSLITAGTLILIYVMFELAFSIPLPAGMFFDFGVN
jgi:putative tricarboxylic transport membrane protein